MFRPPFKPNLLSAFAVGHFANEMVPIGMYILIPAYGTAMDLSAAEIGLLFMIHSLGGSIAFLPAGMLADHVANRGIILAITFFWVGFGYLAASFSDGFWPFAILIAIAAMGDATWHHIATGILAQAHKARRAYALGIHAIGGHLAEVVALPVAGLVLATRDWRVAMQVLVIPTFLVGVIFVLIRGKVPRHVNSRPTKADLMDIWRVWTSRADGRAPAWAWLSPAWTASPPPLPSSPAGWAGTISPTPSCWRLDFPWLRSYSRHRRQNRYRPWRK